MCIFRPYIGHNEDAKMELSERVALYYLLVFCILFSFLFVSIDSNWSGLVNALSGQFCASLNYLQKSVSVSPIHTFKPMGLWPADKQTNSNYLRYATLPREMVCTENLTPWRKLLPCGNKVGLYFFLDSIIWMLAFICQAEVIIWFQAYILNLYMLSRHFFW